MFIQKLCERVGKSAASKAQKYANPASISKTISKTQESLVQKIHRYSINFFVHKPLEKIAEAFTSASISLDLYLFTNEMRGKSKKEIEYFLYGGEFYKGKENGFMDMYGSCNQYQNLDLHQLKKIIIAKEFQGEAYEKEAKDSGIDHLAYMQLYKILLRDLSKKRASSLSFDNLNKVYIESLLLQNRDPANTRKMFFKGLRADSTFKSMPKYYQKYVLETAK